jgi:hypothetical protein
VFEAGISTVNGEIEKVIQPTIEFNKYRFISEEGFLDLEEKLKKNSFLKMLRF